MKFYLTLALAFVSVSLAAQTAPGPQINIRVAAEAESIQTRVDTVYMRTDPNITKDATFAGGEQGWNEFVEQNLKYPVEPEAMTEDKKVVFSFVVTDKGETRQLRISRSAEWEFDKNAMHLMQKMPLWNPAEIGDKPVSIYCIMTVVFKSKGQKPVAPAKRKAATRKK